MWRLETQLRGNLNRPDFLYEATRVYLMLGNAGPLDVSLVREWMKLDWQTAYPGLGYAAAARFLCCCISMLCCRSVAAGEARWRAGRHRACANAPRVAGAARLFAHSSLRRRAASAAVAAERRAGPGGTAAVRPGSGKRLNEGIPGFFTVDGFHKVLLPSLAGADQERRAESWVLGKRVAFDASDPQMQALRRDVIALYEADFVPPGT